MTMHRRPLGGGRTLAAVGAIVILVGCVLPWWQLAQPGGGLPPLTGNGQVTFADGTPGSVSANERYWVTGTMPVRIAATAR